MLFTYTNSTASTYTARVVENGILVDEYGDIVAHSISDFIFNIEYGHIIVHSISNSIFNIEYGIEMDTEY